MSMITQYEWPGNVRELENAIERAVAVSKSEEGVIGVEHLPESVRGTSSPVKKDVQIPTDGVNFEEQISQIEKEYLLEALRAANGVRTHAADLIP